jgi:hypothetical protein
MFSDPAAVPSALASFRLENRMIPYNLFIPKLHNWCIGMGFTEGRIIPSRAFCSDESQGFPVILLAKHFGAFPFNHGRVGGIVSIERHGPHADHGKDLVLVQASHVGYEPETGEFGIYRRLQTENEKHSCSCGKIGHVIDSYAKAYAYASENVRLLRHDGQLAVLIDYMLIARQRREGLFLHAEQLVRGADHGQPRPVATRSTGHVFHAADSLITRLGEDAWPEDGSAAIGKRLVAEDFYFKHEGSSHDPFQDQLETNLITPMPWILSSRHPLLTAACANTLAEFERTYRSLVQSPEIQQRNLVFISGLNIDISPQPGDDFPLTKFIPWAAFVQLADGSREILEQDALFERLANASSVNPAQIDLEKSLAKMGEKRDTVVRF